jgi:hypothetical protein
MIFGLASVMLIGGVKIYVDMMAASKPLPRRRSVEPSSQPDSGWTYHPPGK